MGKKLTETSFISERTIELLIAPRVINLFLKKYSFAIPLSFLRTREGSRLSQQIKNSEKVEIISVFARRPKVITLGDENIVVKFNSILKRHAQIAWNEYKIPSFAGVPLISQILDLRKDYPIAWFKIKAAGKQEFFDTYLHISITDGKILQSLHAQSIEPINDNQKIISHELRWVSWAEAIEILRELRRLNSDLQNEYNRGFFYFYSGPHRPVYFILGNVN